MSLRYSLVSAALAALATIALMAGQMGDINAQNQTISSSALGNLVLFESPTTVILGADGTTSLWKAIDMAKQSGYKIDTVTVITEETPIGTRITLTPVYTVFMSK